MHLSSRQGGQAVLLHEGRTSGCVGDRSGNLKQLGWPGIPPPDWNVFLFMALWPWAKKVKEREDMVLTRELVSGPGGGAERTFQNSSHACFLELVSPETQATNGHFQNYKK